MLTPEIIEKRIKENYPKGVELSYVDYRDSFDENEKMMEELASTGFIDSFFEGNFWDDFEEQNTAIKYIVEETFNKEEQKEIEDSDDLRDATGETCRSIDTSDVLKDLLENTPRRFFFYDLGFTLENHDGFQNVTKEAQRIAKKLKIDYTKFEKELHELVANASYGGDLVILFTARPKDLFGEKPNNIIFKDNYELCIMDRCQGSGHSVQLKTELTFKFIRENLHDDEGSPGYSFSGDVCGMCGWDEADFQWTNKKPKTRILAKENKKAKEFSAREKRYEERWKKGECTAGDMNMKRHADTSYINDYPCGTKCEKCGTFWID